MIDWTLNELQALISILGAVAGALWAAYRYILRPWAVTPARAFLRRIDEGLVEVAGLRSDVTTIKAAVGDNGGRSMADKVARTEGMVRLLSARQTGLTYAVLRAVFETDGSGRCIDVNRSFLDLIGVSRDNVLGMEWVNVIHPDDRDRVMTAWEHAIADKREFRESFRYHGRNGTIAASVEARPMSDPVSQSIIGWMGIVKPMEAAS